MYNLDKYQVKVHVNLPNGLYRFTSTSAKGKSYLAYWLLKYRSYGEPVGAYTYTDFQKGVDLVAYAKGCKLFVVDRYDMYYGYALKEIQELSKECIVLIDLKASHLLPVLPLCGLILRVREFLIT